MKKLEKVGTVQDGVESERYRELEHERLLVYQHGILHFPNQAHRLQRHRKGAGC